MDVNMTKGNPAKIMIKFFIPMFIGNLFQQLYGVVDSVFIGRFVGTQAFAAVGSSLLLTNFLTSILIGLAIGVSALFSQLYGANKLDILKKTIATASIFILGFSLLLSVGSVLFLEPLLRLFQMPAELMTYAKDYLYYIFIGLFFAGVYNIASYIMRSVGDSKTPVMILILTSVINIVLDAVFILSFHMGAGGAGLATLIAQVVSAIVSIMIVLRKTKFLNWKKEDLKFETSLFPEILKFSVLTSIQQSISSFGMMLVQGIVNTFGSTAMAAFAACSKIDEFANRPLQDLGNAAATFTAQNKGADETERVKQGFRITIVMIAVVSLVISLVAVVFAPQLIGIFVKGEAVEVIQTGVRYQRIVAPCYFFLGLIVMFYGFFRAMGEIKFSILMTIVSQGIRVALSLVLTKTSLGFIGVSWAVCLGWLLSDLLGFILYFITMKKEKISKKMQTNQEVQLSEGAF